MYTGVPSERSLGRLVIEVDKAVYLNRSTQDCPNEASAGVVRARRHPVSGANGSSLNNRPAMFALNRVALRANFN